MLRKLLDGIEARLLGRKHSRARLRFAAHIAELREQARREVRLADGRAREETAAALLDPEMAEATKAAMDRLASRYASEVHNIAVTIYEEHFAKTPANVRYGHFNRNAFPVRQGAIQIGRFDESIPLSKLDKED